MSVNPISRDDITGVVLTDGDMRVSLLSYGAITQGWSYKDTPLILGYDDPTAYLTDRASVGAIVGRVANRIGGARFNLGDHLFTLGANEGRNTLHGGAAGLSHRNWGLERVSTNSVLLRCTSQDGEGGFPGEVQFEIRVSLECPRLVYSISARPDRPTPISIAQHNYYSLGIQSDVSGHSLKLASDRYLEIDEQGIPTGRIANASADDLDFTSPRAIRNAARDLDHYFIFKRDDNPGSPVAVLAASSGLTMSVYSDQPGAQVYSGVHLTDPFHSRGGICIEPSGYPNAPNIAAFPSIVCTPDNPYRQTLALEISEGQA